MIKKTSTMPKRTSTREVQDRDREINVMRILANPHPENVDDYAIHLYYRSRNRSPFFKVTDKRIVDSEVAELIINGKKYVRVNIYTGSIVEQDIDSSGV